jgi:cell division protein ZapA
MEADADRGALVDPRSTRVQVLGQEYVVRSEAAEEYVKEIADFVNARMQGITERYNLVSTTKIAVYAALEIADELFRERQRRERTEDDVSTKARQLCEVLSRAL